MNIKVEDMAKAIKVLKDAGVKSPYTANMSPDVANDLKEADLIHRDKKGMFIVISSIRVDLEITDCIQ